MSSAPLGASNLILSLTHSPLPETAIQALNTYIQDETPQQVMQRLGQIRTEVLNGLFAYQNLSDRTLLVLTTEIQRRNGEYIRNEFQRVDELIADCTAKEECLTRDLELLKLKQKELGNKVDLIVVETQLLTGQLAEKTKKAAELEQQGAELRKRIVNHEQNMPALQATLDELEAEAAKKREDLAKDQKAVQDLLDSYPTQVTDNKKLEKDGKITTGVGVGVGVAAVVAGIVFPPTLIVTVPLGLAAAATTVGGVITWGVSWWRGRVLEKIEKLMKED